MREENIERMNFKELRAEVQLLRDELAVFKRKMEDAMYNLDGDNFSGVYTAEQDDMKAQVKITTDAITALVAEKENFATITMLSDSITSTVRKSITAYFEKSKEPTALNTSAEEKTMLCLYDDEYYYFDDFDNKWKIYPEGGLKTLFKQTADKFELTGNVKISGSVIATGSITGDKISGGTIEGVTVTGATVTTTTTTNKDGVRLQNYGEYGGMLEVLYGGVIHAHWEPAMEYYSAGGYAIGSYLKGDNNTRISIRDISASGNWDFSRCDKVTGLSPVAVFG